MYIFDIKKGDFLSMGSVNGIGSGDNKSNIQSAFNMQGQRHLPRSGGEIEIYIDFLEKSEDLNKKIEVDKEKGTSTLTYTDKDGNFVGSIFRNGKNTSVRVKYGDHETTYNDLDGNGTIDFRSTLNPDGTASSTDFLNGINSYTDKNGLTFFSPY